MREVVMAHAPLPCDGASEAAQLVDDLGYDSLGLLELACTIERKFELPSIADEEVMGVKTLGDVERLVARLQERGNGR